MRQRESKPVVERYFAWCHDEATRALDETPLAKGIRYALNQRAALERFLEVKQRLEANIYRRATLGPSSVAALDAVR